MRKIGSKVTALILLFSWMIGCGRFEAFNVRTQDSQGLQAAVEAAPVSLMNPSVRNFEMTFYPAQFPDQHQTGKARNHQEWEASVADASEKFLTFGPYTTQIPAGFATARFFLSVDNHKADDLKLVTLDVFDSTAQKVLNSRQVRRKEFRGSYDAQEFDVNFFQIASHSLEFRVYYHGYSHIIHSKTTVFTVPQASQAEFAKDPMGAFWNGQAQFRIVRMLNWPVSEGAGWFTVKDGAWYVFNRDVNHDPNLMIQCKAKNLDVAQTVVRVSYDQGATWSEKQVAARPDPTNQHMNCAILDGSTFYDEDTGIWHMITQCLGTSASWKLCHYTRKANTPLGEFISNPQNPVVSGSQLWKIICSGNGKSCPTTVFDEGTPDILMKKDGYFYLTFHGYDGGPKTGYRGMARTRDFRNYEVSGADLPGDAIFGPQDCQAWNPGCIGGGAAGHIRSGGYNYMMIEAPDLGLACTENQYWVFGLMRSPTFARSGQWESFAQNPVLKPMKRRACGLQYARFIEDRGSIFLVYEDADKGRRLFQLLPGSGTPLIE